MNKLKSPSPMKMLLHLTILLLLCLAGSELLAQFPGIDAFNESWIDAHTRNNGLQGIVQFVLVATLLLSIGLPRQIAAFLGGYSFGFIEGLTYSMVAVTFSCSLTFMLARLYARPVSTRLFPSRVDKIDQFLSLRPFVMAIIIRLLPIGNNLITNLIAGVSQVSALSFIGGSAVGYLPQMLIFALMGKGVVIQSFWKMTISVALLGLSTLLGLYLFRLYKAEKVLLDQSDNTASTLHTTNK